MSQDTVRVIARISAQPDKVQEVQALLQELVEPTRQETGCLSYHLLRHRTEPFEFTCIEEWASDAAIDALLPRRMCKTLCQKFRVYWQGSLIFKSMFCSNKA